MLLFLDGIGFRLFFPPIDFLSPERIDFTYSRQWTLKIKDSCDLLQSSFIGLYFLVHAPSSAFPIGQYGQHGGIWNLCRPRSIGFSQVVFPGRPPPVVSIGQGTRPREEENDHKI